jgi:Cupin-like domain
MRPGSDRLPEERKLLTLTELYAELDRQARQDNTVPRVRITSADFYEHYFYPNRPVIVEGLMASWDAPAKWTVAWLSEQFGENLVTVHADRSKDPLYEQHLSRGCRVMRFADFLDTIASGGESNDLYLVGRNQLLARPEFRRLLDDVESPAGFLDPANMDSRHIKLWIGSGGTITPLHHDRGSVFFGQVRGRKQIKLISPFHLRSLYNDPANCYSPVSPAGPIDTERFPAMRDVPIMEAVVGPGDFLLIPVGWWHWVRSLDLSMSLSCKNFFFRGKRISWEYR